MTLMPAQRLEARVPAMRRRTPACRAADADITIFDPTNGVGSLDVSASRRSRRRIQHVIVNGRVSGSRTDRRVEGVAPGRPCAERHPR